MGRGFGAAFLEMTWLAAMPVAPLRVRDAAMRAGRVVSAAPFFVVFGEVFRIRGGSVENDHPEVLMTCQLQSVPQRWKDTQKV